MSSEKIAVVGMGLLGRGIAGCFLGHGFRVVTLARSDERNAEALEQLQKMMEELVHQGGFDADLLQAWKSNLTQTTHFDAIQDCTFVVESVAEDRQTKREVLQKIEQSVGTDVVIASNSSAIPISVLQQDRKFPHRIIGMHWAEPAHATRFLELVPGEHTTAETLARTSALARQLGKDPSVCQKEIAGFIVNRIGYAMYREALSLVELGVADFETIDRSFRNALGLWATICGPFRWMDLTGGPELYLKGMKSVLPTLNNSTEPSTMMQKLATSGARGIINGRGFFNYTPEEAQHWEELYRKHAWRVSKMQKEYFSPGDNQTTKL